MGQKIGLAVTFVLVVAAGLAANSFGFLGLNDVLYVGKLVAGWAGYTIVVALLYAGLEKLLPGLLCTASPESSNNPPPA